MKKCADDPELKEKLKALLKAHEEAGNFLESILINLQSFFQEEPKDPWLGKHLGPYRIDRIIGHGGMGTIRTFLQSVFGCTLCSPKSGDSS